MKEAALHLVGPILMAALTVTVWQIETHYQKNATPETTPVITHQPPAFADGPIWDDTTIASLDPQNVPHFLE